MTHDQPQFDSVNPEPQQGDADWVPCEQGTIAGLVTKLCARRKMLQVRQVAVLATCLLAAVMVGRQMFAPPQSLTHAQVVALADDFIEGKLDTATTRLVEQHIETCDVCRHLLEDRQVNQQQTKLVMPDQSVVMLDISTQTLLASSH